MSLLRIGICDEEELCLEWVETVVRKVISEMNRKDMELSIQCFNHGDKVYEALRKEPFQLVFLNVEMPKSNGFELAKRLSCTHPEIQKVFVSGHENYVFDAYEFDALWFVRKRCLEADVFRAIKKYFRNTDNQFASYQWKDRKGKQAVPLKNIMYFECSGHEITIITRKAHYQTWGSLKQIESELPEHDFVRIHKNYLVNLRFAYRVCARSLELMDGSSVDVGKYRKKMLCEKMSEYGELGY